MGTPTLPSALLRFTSEFGMGSGGATVLLSLDKKVTILKAVARQSDKYKSVFLFNALQCVIYSVSLLQTLRSKTTWVLYG
jgi:hypothetical protein